MKWKWRNDRPSERNLCNCVKKPDKNSGLQRGLNPWPRDYRRDALPTELWSHWRWDVATIISSFSFHFRSSCIWFISYITNIHFFHENIWNHNWPAPNVSGFIAQFNQLELLKLDVLIFIGTGFMSHWRWVACGVDPRIKYGLQIRSAFYWRTDKIKLYGHAFLWSCCVSHEILPIYNVVSIKSIYLIKCFSISHIA